MARVTASTVSTLARKVARLGRKRGKSQPPVAKGVSPVTAVRLMPLGARRALLVAMRQKDEAKVNVPANYVPLKLNGSTLLVPPEVPQHLERARRVIKGLSAEATAALQASHGRLNQVGLTWGLTQGLQAGGCFADLAPAVRSELEGLLRFAEQSQGAASKPGLVELPNTQKE